MSVFDAVTIQYGEIALKGDNRGMFEDLLFRNIKTVLPPAFKDKIKKRYGRFVISAEIGEEEKKALSDILSKVFGVANFVFARRAPLDMEAIKNIAAEIVGSAPGASFKIATRRPNKLFPARSMEISAAVGGYVLGKTGKKVDVKNPDITCFITVAEKEAYLSSETVAGPGGLPSGISGKVAVLLSGGIDSPVAAWKMMRRGACVDFIHFHSYPYTDKASLEKVKELALSLRGWQNGGSLYLVPFIDIQKAIMTACNAKYRVLLYRRMMLKIAERLANASGAAALVTGENLGQVASQTLPNMIAVQKAIAMSVLRPLIGENKDDIIATARDIGTFEISIRPHQDCCSLFVPKNPATKSRVLDLEAEEAKLDVGDLVKNAIEKIEKIEFLSQQHPANGQQL